MNVDGKVIALGHVVFIRQLVITSRGGFNIFNRLARWWGLDAFRLNHPNLPQFRHIAPTDSEKSQQDGHASKTAEDDVRSEM
jgi:hypothetical protein